MRPPRRNPELADKRVRRFGPLSCHALQESVETRLLGMEELLGSNPRQGSLPVSFNGRMPGFHPGDESSILSTGTMARWSNGKAGGCNPPIPGSTPGRASTPVVKLGDLWQWKAQGRLAASCNSGAHGCRGQRVETVIRKLLPGSSPGGAPRSRGPMDRATAF